jgi:hypothetical protein
MSIKAYIPDFLPDIVKSCPLYTESQIKFICDRIKENKIPILKFLPKEIHEYTKTAFWVIPFAIYGDKLASFILVDKNGIHALHEDDNNVATIFAWDQIDHIYQDWPEGNLRTVNLCVDETGEKYLSLDEFIPDNRGSYLDVLIEIYNTYKPVIEASRDLETWKHGAGGEAYVNFNSLNDLLKKECWGVSEVKQKVQQSSSDNKPKKEVESKVKNPPAAKDNAASALPADQFGKIDLFRKQLESVVSFLKAKGLNAYSVAESSSRVSVKVGSNNIIMLFPKGKTDGRLSLRITDGSSPKIKSLKLIDPRDERYIDFVFNYNEAFQEDVLKDIERVYKAYV